MSYSLQDELDMVISDTVVTINEVINRTMPKQLSDLAQDIFDSSGTTHGRQWDYNAKSTIKKKGFDHRNVDTGILEDFLTTEGNLMDDDYMGHLPTPVDGEPDGYLYANDLAPFDDIGRTEKDKKWLIEQIIKELQYVYR